MDFAWSEEQTELAGLAGKVFADHATHERLSQLEAAGDTVFDRDLWARLAETGVLAAVVPEGHGGSGLGLLELLGVLEEQGNAVAPVPLVPTLVLGALPVAAFGTAEQQATLLPGVADGSIVLTAALDPDVVPYGQHADRILVPHGDAVLLVDPAADGVRLTELVPTNRQPAAALELSEGALAAAEVLDGPNVTRWITERGAAAICAVQAGVCAAALAMTAEHARTRVQFGKAIGEFQAVGQRAADAFIDAEMVRLTAYQAIFRLAQGWPAANEVAVAKFWAGDGGMRVVHAAQHLHGGIGVDTDYPLHRYFLWAKQNEHTLGTPTRELIRLGSALADELI